MGYAIAEEIAEQGAEVFLISGPVAVSTSKKGIQVIPVKSAKEMYDACMHYFPQCNGAVMAAAVADFTPASPASAKTKRGNENWNLELVPTRDIAAALGKIKKTNQLLAGFALETNDELENAKKKLAQKNLDFIVLNSLNDKGAGFGGDTNKITIVGRNNNHQHFELKTKREVAADIVQMMVSLLH
jgi:phosphopantothenoylcysteine decarboxylase/phosphopantothenate--cysteine ligase